MKEIFEFAMQMEKDGEAYYRDVAKKCGNAGLQQILTMMADEEVKHYNIFKKMSEGKGEYTSSTLMSGIKNVFQQIREEGQTFDFDASHEDYYRKAQEVEKKSEDFYRAKAEETDDEREKMILHKIADEEHHHFQVLENIIDFINKPGQWLENAEWHNMGE